MRQICSIEETLCICKALASPIRMQIIKILAEENEINMNEMATKIGITNGAISQHIKILEEANIIDMKMTSGKRGSQKICFLKETKFLIDTLTDTSEKNTYCVELPIGSYTRYEVYPTCGISTKSAIIGEVDDARYFDAPERSEASIVWFGKGFLEYRLPNYLKANQKLVELQIALEISSEAPGICEEWPSDIYFYLNDISLGYWTSPGDFGAVPGIYTPAWWHENWNQYGLLKLLSINKEGVFIDGRKVSDYTINQFEIDYKSDLTFRIEVPSDADHVGGLTIFGKGFGNYNQDISVRAIFEEK